VKTGFLVDQMMRFGASFAGKTPCIICLITSNFKTFELRFRLEAGSLLVLFSPSCQHGKAQISRVH
jgi:hypothetical protein